METGAEKARGGTNYTAHYMRLATDTTVTIGSSSDFDGLQEAVDAYSGCILEANLTFQLEENLTPSTFITISRFVSAGGKLVIDLNGYSIAGDASKVLFFKECQGLNAVVQGPGEISSDKDGANTYLVFAQRVGNLHVVDFDLKYTGDNTGYGVYFYETRGTVEDLDTDNTNPVDYTYRAEHGSFIGEEGVSEAGSSGIRFLVDGALAVATGGNIYTEAGSLSPS
jgi:hypothetical protein